MHDGNRYLRLVQLVHLIHHILTDMPLFLLRKLRKGAVCTLADSIYNLLHIEGFLTSVLFYHFHVFLCLVCGAVIQSILARLFYCNAHFVPFRIISSSAAAKQPATYMSLIHYI